MNSAYLSFVRDNFRFLSFGVLLAWCSSFGQTYFISVFGGEIRAEFDLSHGDFGLIYSTATLASGVCLIWAGRQIDRFDLRPFTAATCLCLAVASLGIGLATTTLALGLAIFGLRLAGQGLMSHAALTSMARYFEADRGKAISLANLGFPAGQATFPLIGVALAAAIGWRQGWFVMVAVLAVVLTPLLLWLLKGHGERHARMLARTERGAGGDGGDGARQWSAAEVRRDVRFWLVMPAVLSLSFVGTGIVFHQVHLTEIKGWSLAWFAANYMGMAAAMVGTALIVGPLIDRVGAARLMAPYLVPAAISLVLLAGTDGLWVVPVFMVAQGISGGMSRVVLGALWAEWYGVRHLGAIRSLVAAAMVMASAASPVLFGWLIDIGVTFDAFMIASAVYLAVSIAMIMIAERLPASG